MRAMPDDFLQINDQVVIPLSELSFRYARSSGPGGQHVQRTETKVELLFDLAGSPSLSEAQRQLALSRLGGRVDQLGILHLDLADRQEPTGKPRRRNRAFSPFAGSGAQAGQVSPCDAADGRSPQTTAGRKAAARPVQTSARPCGPGRMTQRGRPRGECDGFDNALIRML